MRHWYWPYILVKAYSRLLSLSLSVAGTAAAKPARRAAAATPLATAAPSASTKTGRGTTSFAAQDFRLNPNRSLPSLRAGRQRQQPPPESLLSVWQGSRPLKACPQSPVLVERRHRSLLAPLPPPPPPRPPRPTDTEAASGGTRHKPSSLTGEELNQRQEGTIRGLS